MKCLEAFCFLLKRAKGCASEVRYSRTSLRVSGRAMVTRTIRRPRENCFPFFCRLRKSPSVVILNSLTAVPFSLTPPLSNSDLHLDRLARLRLLVLVI